MGAVREKPRGPRPRKWIGSDCLNDASAVAVSGERKLVEGSAVRTDTFFETSRACGDGRRLETSRQILWSHRPPPGVPDGDNRHNFRTCPRADAAQTQGTTS
jgi:hypothetical protein